MRTNRISGHVSKPQKQINVNIRWLIRLDMGEVLKIEHESFEVSWTDKDFLSCFRQGNCIGMVAEYDQKIVGFMLLAQLFFRESGFRAVSVLRNHYEESDEDGYLMRYSH
jgi:[ribosomal protein S18]-alanine N-acetyltransferase